MTDHSTTSDHDAPLELPDEVRIAPAARSPLRSEQFLIADAATVAKPPRVQVRLHHDDRGRLALGPPHTDSAGHRAVLSKVLASSSDAFIGTALARIAKCRWVGGPKEDDINAALAIIEAAEPKNELESALAAQMAMCHQLGMRMLARASREEDDPERAGGFMKTAGKAIGLYTDMMLALHKVRKKGDQHIRVEHLHLGPGAQAIIANGVSGRGQPDFKGQPDGAS